MDLDQAFKNQDKENKGLIDLEGLSSVLKQTGHSNESTVDLLALVDRIKQRTVTLDHVRRIIAYLDASEDTRNAFHLLAGSEKHGITRTALKEACEKHDIDLRQMNRMMDEADKNQDGLIDFEEFEAVFDKAGVSG
ncbi:hypothetical protein J3Q64DRAFT_1111809 [Phycomyces blakesleeanus]|uniref:EF-hand domain-containing protein n=2 Tax=Phycomyces blakesleeanus TaxID=4837 RepID=A0A163AKP2_PHYB8|nr:hypothetical protein PHYBLDRAFT_181134 [Phycomyces blakesleeanus NRRL 1555(-)]OAD74171.1 hypothetical protein PHYBLDRAFT_181134 [Phycomyces blakesleeanus NRRL 1555(-)]|eukprot:XP_018292211.1 hypothetical protein PHYBLDRAFT_181134 [Phycomyces blakesleeanus NRRL 1555(-)]